MNNYVLLNNVEHKNVKVITDRAARYGDDVSYSRIFPLEFRNVQSCYPIFFRKDDQTGLLFPIALFGLEGRENLYLSDAGWDAPYIPLMIRRHPFLIGRQQVQGQGDTALEVVSIDMNSPRVNESEGEVLFLEHGGTSEYLASITDLLETIRLASDMSGEFINTLLDLDLIESVALDVKLKDGSKNELAGLYTINEENLQQLDGAALEKLHKKRYLESVFMVLASLSCFRTLVQKKSDQLAEVQ